MFGVHSVPVLPACQPDRGVLVMNSSALDGTQLIQQSELQGHRSSQATGPSIPIASQRLQTVPEASGEGLRDLVAGR